MRDLPYFALSDMSELRIGPLVVFYSGLEVEKCEFAVFMACLEENEHE